METNIKEYIHYYIGQEAFSYDEQRNGIIVGIGTDFVTLDFSGVGLMADFTNIKPILRRIESLNYEEMKTVNLLMEKQTDGVHAVYITAHSPKSFHYLLSIGIDLFSLIDSNHAIEK